MISDPPLMFDYSKIGEKVAFNSFKFDSIDGFVKTGEDCYVILPPIYKQSPNPSTAPTNQEKGEVIIKANILPLSYEFPWFTQTDWSSLYKNKESRMILKYRHTPNLANLGTILLF